MKYLLILLLTASLSADNYWDETDDKPYFQQRDNQAHIALGALVSGVVSSTAKSNYGLSDTEAWFFGLGAALLVGTIKEVSDNNFDGEDLSGWALGGAVGSSMIILRF